MDAAGLRRVLTDLRAGKIETIAREVPEPSVFAHEILNSNPYTFLDDAPLEERRTRAVAVRRSSSGASSRNVYGFELRISCANTDGSGTSRAMVSILPARRSVGTRRSPAASIASVRQSRSGSLTSG